MTTETLSAKDVATLCNTDAKTLRKFLRTWFSETERNLPGQGGRYEFTKAEANKVVKAFAAAPKKVTGEGKASKSKRETSVMEVDVDEIIEDFDLDDLEGPTDDEVEDLTVDDDGEDVGLGEDAGEVGEIDEEDDVELVDED